MSTTSTKNWTSSWKLPLVSSILLFVILYGLVPYTFRYNVQEPISIFHILYLFWTEMADWEHGLLVVPICLGLIYWRRANYRSLPVAPDNRAWPLFLLGFLLYFVGYKGDIKPFAFASIQIWLAALVIWFYGWQLFKAALFPWAFLTFAWPMPGIDGVVAFPLREFMSAITNLFLNTIGIAAMRVGTAVVSAPDYARGIPAAQRFALDVADPCSGIRSLFALMMVTALYGYITLPKTWQKLALFICALPLAVLGNFVRMLMLTFGTIILGSDIAIGPPEKPSHYHEIAGYVVFITAVGGMLLVSWLLELNWPRAWNDFKQWAATPGQPRSALPRP